MYVQLELTKSDIVPVVVLFTDDALVLSARTEYSGDCSVLSLLSCPWPLFWQMSVGHLQASVHPLPCLTQEQVLFLQPFLHIHPNRPEVDLLGLGGCAASLPPSAFSVSDELKVSPSFRLFV